MANFSQQAPIQFAPYTPQYNTQLYAQIGMNRQAAYDTNVQKIQSYVDSVAGISVTRDVDKQYLQGKLNELKGNLDGISQGDFSKNEVLNTAGGYVKYIANDKNIINAAMSTANIQKDYQAMQKAREEGKSAASNDSYLQGNIESYMNSDQLGATYQAQGYTPYYNISEAFGSWYKDKNGNIQVEETPMSVNEDGTPNWRAYTLVNGKREYLSAAQVANDFQTFLSLDQQASQQFGIDSQYYAKNISNEQSLSLLNETYNRQLQTTDQEIESTEVLFNNSTGEERTRLEDKLDALRTTRNNTVSQHQQAQKDFEENPEAFKRGTYMQSVVAGVGNRYAYESVETTLKKNPIAEMELQRQKFEAQENERKFRRELDTQKYLLDKEKFEAKEATAERGSIGPGGTIMPGDAVPGTVTPTAVTLEEIQAKQDVLQEEVFSGAGGIGQVLYFSQGNKNGAIIKSEDGRYIANPDNPQGWEKLWSDLFTKWQKDPNSAPYMEKFQRGRNTEGAPARKWQEWRMNRKIIRNELQNFNESLTPQQKDAQNLVDGIRDEIDKFPSQDSREYYNRYLDLVLNNNGQVSREDVDSLNQQFPNAVLGTDARDFLERVSEELYPTVYGASGGSGAVNVPGLGQVNLPRFMQRGQNSLYRVAQQYNESGILEPRRDLAARLATTNQNVSVSLTPKESQDIIPSILNAASSREVGGKAPEAFKTMQEVLNANGAKNTSVTLYKDPTTGKSQVTMTGMGKNGFAVSEALELMPDEAAVLFGPEINYPVENELEVKAIDLSDNQTTEGLIDPYVPQVNVNTKYAFQTHFGEMNGEYYPKVMYFDREDQSKGWRQLPIVADMYFQDMNGQRGSGITRSKEFVNQLIYKLDAETFENKWIK